MLRLCSGACSKYCLFSLVILACILLTCYQYVFSFTVLHNKYKALIGVGVMAQLEGSRIRPPDPEARHKVVDVIVREVIRTPRPHEELRLSDKVTTSVISSSSSTSTTNTSKDESEVLETTEVSLANGSLPQCQDIPPGLEGRLEVNLTVISMDAVINENPLVMLGGENSPEECRARDSVAIIVPYRDRYDQLLVFLRHIHPFLSKQQVHYRLYIINQADSNKFNRAMLMNVGFSEALKDFNWDCFIFHDVDLLPEDDRNLYTCPDMPRHMSVAVDKFKYKLPYKSIFGGVAAIKQKQFQQLNGFSNMFWGWGGEDDDMSRRIHKEKLKITRYQKEIARYTMIKHKQQPVNKERVRILKTATKRYLKDGLNSLKYKVESRQLQSLYTNVSVLLERKEQENKYLRNYHERRKFMGKLHKVP